MLCASRNGKVSTSSAIPADVLEIKIMATISARTLLVKAANESEIKYLNQVNNFLGTNYDDSQDISNEEISRFDDLTLIYKKNHARFENQLKAFDKEESQFISEMGNLNLWKRYASLNINGY